MRCAASARSMSTSLTQADELGPRGLYCVVLMARTSTPRAPENASEATASIQDYLAAIYDLAGSSTRPVIGARVAKHMSISAPAVTEAIHRMARGGYVKIGADKSLTLTPKGHEIAEV